MVLISCSNAQADSITSGNYWKPCKLKKLQPRQERGGPDSLKYSRALERSGKVNNSLIEKKVDIMGGHFKLGSGDSLRTPSGNPWPIRYITFVREPMTRYVSGFVFSKRRLNLTFDEAVRRIKVDVTNQRQQGKYWMRVKDYLLTPQQTEDQNRKNDYLLGIQATTELIMRNLVRYNVLLGVVERMAESMELLQHVLDHEKKWTWLFGRYGLNTPATTNSSRSATGVATVNKSKLSTREILAELSRDDEFFQSFQEYVKYEKMVYDFVVDIHSKQYAAIQESF
jgi:hypothetical protein